MITAGEFKDLRRTKKVQMESEIDEIIERAAIWGETSVRFNIKPHWDRAVDLEEVLARYRMNGWTTEVHYDFRDGDFVWMRVGGDR